MTKRSLTILAIVVVLAGAGAAVIASSINSLSPAPVHTLPGGKVHTGAMPSGGMGGMDK